MPATSPSPSKRPSMAERSSSTLSLSSSGRPPNTNKGHKVHVVTKHNRNASHGKGLNRLAKAASTANVTADGKTQQRRKTGQATTPTESPRTSATLNMKRNSSHAALPKNTSHGNLRKNHSASALASKRNRSHGALMKLGAQAAQKPKENDTKHGVFDLGDQSSDEDAEEGEWEDSTTQSPEMSRNQSKASTPLRPRTPNNELQKAPDTILKIETRMEDPPEASINKSNYRSAPNLTQAQTQLQAQLNDPPADPALLQGKTRSSRAPPAMSTVSAQAGQGTVSRSGSARSLTVQTKPDPKAPSLNSSTPGVGTASSGSGGVSHFLQSSSVATSSKTFETGSDEDSSSGFMANYKPQLPDSPERSRSMLNKMSARVAPSRTNQKMELQRRETMRAAATPTAPQGPGSLGLNAGSAVSLHSRSGSKGAHRNRTVAGEIKALKQDYEAGVKQLTVVRRFRNPMLESLHRLQDREVISSDVGSKSQAGSQPKSRPQSRRGISTSATATPKTSMARSPEDRKILPPPGTARSEGHSKPGRVQFQLSRQGSHDDIGLTTSQGSPGEFEEEQDGVSPEEALIRRIWESRVVFENEGVQNAAA